MDRLTIVSCDCHAATTPAEYREYLEPAYPEGYDALQANPEAVRRRAAQIIGPSAPSGDRDGEREPLWSVCEALAMPIQVCGFDPRVIAARAARIGPSVASFA